MRSGWLVASTLLTLPLAACSADAPAPDAEEVTDPTMVAVWHLPEGDFPERGDRTIDVMVTQVACNGGRTNPVRAVDTASGDASISIAILVEPVEGVASCPLDEARAYVVELGEPYQDQRLLDSACDAAPAKGTSWCEDGGVRFDPAVLN